MGTATLQIRPTSQYSFHCSLWEVSASFVVTPSSNAVEHAAVPLEGIFHCPLQAGAGSGLDCIAQQQCHLHGGPGHVYAVCKACPNYKTS